MAILEARGWLLVAEYVDNSISASDALKVRPGYDAMCEAFKRGEFDALVCWDLDRLTRQPRQLEDWIDAAEGRALALVTANGEADLTTDGGRMYARIKAAVARAEVERKGARQKAAARQRAEMGIMIRATPPRGYDGDGKLVPGEAEVIAEMFARFAAGETIEGLVRWLNAGPLKPRRAAQWTHALIRLTLRNPRYAGRSLYRGEDIGEGTWEPIVEPALFAVVQARLDDPRRLTAKHGCERRYLGSGLYVCSKCGGRAISSGSQYRSRGSTYPRHRYTCRNRCRYRLGEGIDDYVVRLVRERLAQPDLRAMLARPADKSELAWLAKQRDALTQRRETIEADYDAGLIDGRRLKAATEKLDVQLAEIATKQARMAIGPASILAAPDPVAAFDAASLMMRREVIDTLVTVTLLSAPRGRRGFDPESVSIEWKRPT